jgi:ferredoxin
MRLLPSTRRFFSVARRTPGYSLFDFLHAYVYGRWPYLYVGIATGEHPIAKRARRLGAWWRRTIRPGADRPWRPDPRAAGAFADGYHGKVVPLDAARQLVQIDVPVALPDLERVIPYRQARDIILENPDHIALLDCPCRASRPNPCLPLAVCLVIGEPFAGFIVEHQPDRARFITANEALAVLFAEDARGHVHHAFFKNAMLNRFYAICNCCACCCGALQAQRHGVPMLASSGHIARVDADRCTACGACVPFCQFRALSLAGVARVEAAACMGCGVCTDKCAQGALVLERDPSRGEPLEIRRLLAEQAQ